MPCVDERRPARTLVPTEAHGALCDGKGRPAGRPLRTAVRRSGEALLAIAGCRILCPAPNGSGNAQDTRAPSHSCVRRWKIHLRSPRQEEDVALLLARRERVLDKESETVLLRRAGHPHRFLAQATSSLLHDLFHEGVERAGLTVQNKHCTLSAIDEGMRFQV